MTNDPQRIADLVDLHALCARYMALTSQFLQDRWLEVFTPDAEYNAFGTPYTFERFPALLAAAPRGSSSGTCRWSTSTATAPAECSTSCSSTSRPTPCAWAGTATSTCARPTAGVSGGAPPRSCARRRLRLRHPPRPPGRSRVSGRRVSPASPRRQNSQVSSAVTRIRGFVTRRLPNQLYITVCWMSGAVRRVSSDRDRASPRPRRSTSSRSIARDRRHRRASTRSGCVTASCTENSEIGRRLCDPRLRGASAGRTTRGGGS